MLRWKERMDRLVPLVCLIFLAPGTCQGQVSPAESQKTLHPPKGMVAELWASEPLLANPTAIEVDSRGRIWIAEGLNYRFFRNGNFKRIPGADRIKILEDTDGDGKADKVTVFAEDIYPVPMGLALQEIWRNGKYEGVRVFVGNSPNLLLLEDLDGDDKAEKRSALLTGFGGVDHDHGVHGMTLGPDGKLYFTQGDGEYAGKDLRKGKGKTTLSVKDASGRWLQNDRLGSTMRVNLDGTDLEILSNGQRNNYEACVDAFGNVFVSDNDDDGNRGSRMIWIMDGGNHGYKMPGSGRHWAEELPGVIPKLVGTGNGSPCGILLADSPLFGPEVDGQVLQVDAGTRQINLHPLVRKGAGFRSDYKVFLKGDDPWFRPIDIALAPDGTLYLCDWYDAGVGGHAFADQTTGRIYRIRPESPRTLPAKPDFQSIAGLLTALDSPNITTRFAARSQLIAMGEKAREPLRQVFRTGSLRSRGRALFVLSALPKTGKEDLPSALQDREPVLREQALRILTRDNRRQGLVDDAEAKKLVPLAAEVLEALRPLAIDPDGGVRRELLLAIRELPTPSIEKELGQLAKGWDGKDRFYLEALRLALVHREPEYLQRLFVELAEEITEDESTAALALPPYFPTATNEAYLRPDDELPGTNAAAKLIGIAWVLERPECLPSLKTLLARTNSPEIARGVELVMGRISDPKGAEFLTEWHARTMDAGQRRAILRLLGVKLAGPWGSARASAATRELFATALAEPGMEVEAIRAIGASGDDHFDDRLLEMVKSPAGDIAVRISALETLGRRQNEGALDVARQWIEETRGEPVSGPLATTGLAVATMGDRKPAQQLLLSVVGDKSYPADLRRKAVGLLALDTPGARRLLTLFTDGNLPEDTRMEAVFLLHNHPDEKIRNVAANRIPLPKLAGGNALSRLDDVLAKQGDVANGERLFRRDASDACARCHRVQGIGNWVGPDLSSIGAKYGARELLYHVLNPSGAIGDTYVPVVVSLADGRVLTGLLADESPERIVLKTAAGERIAVPTTEIEERRPQNQSIMPENLAQSFSAQEIADLIAFLSTLKVPVTEVGEYYLLGPLAKGAHDGASIPDVTRPVSLPSGAESPGRWQRARTSRDMFLDLSSMLGSKTGSEIFAYVPTVSPSAQQAEIILTTTNPVSLWLNGKPVGLVGPEKQGSATFWKGTLDLREGANSLVLEIASGVVDAGLVTTLVAKDLPRVELDAAPHADVSTR